MRYAVKDRPVEEFNTELKLPEWQLEPDDEFYFGDPDDYYYIDEQGNLIEPGVPGEAETPPVPEVPETEPGSGPVDVSRRPQVPGNTAPAAASDDFLNQATGESSDDRGPPPDPPQTPPVN